MNNNASNAGAMDHLVNSGAYAVVLNGYKAPVFTYQAELCL